MRGENEFSRAVPTGIGTVIIRRLGVYLVGLVLTMAGITTAGWTLFGGVASAQASHCSFRQVPSTARAGQTIEVTGTAGFRSGTEFSISLDGVVLTRGSTELLGDFNPPVGNVTIPSNATPGTHTLTLRCARDRGLPLSESTSTSIVITSAAPSGTTPTGAPGTGGTPPATTDVPLEILGAVLAAIGGATVALAARRRRRTVS